MEFLRDDDECADLIKSEHDAIKVSINAELHLDRHETLILEFRKGWYAARIHNSQRPLLQSEHPVLAVIAQAAAG